MFFINNDPRRNQRNQTAKAKKTENVILKFYFSPQSSVTKKRKKKKEKTFDFHTVFWATKQEKTTCCDCGRMEIDPDGAAKGVSCVSAWGHYQVPPQKSLKIIWDSLFYKINQFPSLYTAQFCLPLILLFSVSRTL